MLNWADQWWNEYRSLANCTCTCLCVCVCVYQLCSVKDANITNQQ